MAHQDRGIALDHGTLAYLFLFYSNSIRSGFNAFRKIDLITPPRSLSLFTLLRFRSHFSCRASGIGTNVSSPCNHPFSTAMCNPNRPSCMLAGRCSCARIRHHRYARPGRTASVRVAKTADKTDLIMPALLSDSLLSSYHHTRGRALQ